MSQRLNSGLMIPERAGDCSLAKILRGRVSSRLRVPACFAIPWVSFQSRLIGVGSQNEEAFPQMSCTKAGSGNRFPQHIIPELGKRGEDPSEWGTFLEGEDGAWIFQEAVSRLKLSDDSQGIRPQPSFVSSSTLSADKARRLARHSTRNEVRKAKRVRKPVGSDAVTFSEVHVASWAPVGIRIIWVWFAVINSPAQAGDVAKVWDVRPLFGQHPGGIRGVFHKGDGPASGPFDGQRESANTGKQIEMRHGLW